MIVLFNIENEGIGISMGRGQSTNLESSKGVVASKRLRTTDVE